MGYHVSIDNSTCVLPKEHWEEAYKRLCALNDKNNLKNGGSYPRSSDYTPDKAHQDIWFTWMEWNYPEICKDVKEIFKMLGFEIEIYDNGDIGILGYDNKIGQEDLFFKTIGDLLKGEIYWTGEDGGKWRWVFSNGRMIEQTGKHITNNKSCFFHKIMV